MRYIRYILCVFAGYFGIAGCISTTPYPDDWSRTVSDQNLQCPYLTGSFENYGLLANGPDARDKIILASVFLPFHRLTEPMSKYYELLAVSHMTFDDQGDDGIVVKAWVGDELLRERQLSASQLTCREGHLVYHDTSWDGTGDILDDISAVMFFFGRTSSDHLISPALDGSLVIENKELSMGAVGAIFLTVPVPLAVPVAGKSQFWYIFPRTSPDSPSLQPGSNSPQVVRTGTAPAYSLLPPEGSPRSSGYDDAEKCLKQVSGTNEPLDPQALAMLGGRSTQAFIIQAGKGGGLIPQVRWQDRRIGYVPATHMLRIEKLYWQPPSLTDHYVICLLSKGYHWEDRGELAVGQEFAVP
jgi:hypothetical protein